MTAGVLLSCTKARELEGVGASKIGTVFIFALVATIGLKMDIRAIAHYPGLFAVGGIWMAFYVLLMVATLNRTNFVVAVQMPESATG